jgi:hypothetical protein
VLNSDLKCLLTSWQSFGFANRRESSQFIFDDICLLFFYFFNTGTSGSFLFSQLNIALLGSASLLFTSRQICQNMGGGGHGRYVEQAIGTVEGNPAINEKSWMKFIVVRCGRCQ